MVAPWDDIPPGYHDGSRTTLQGTNPYPTVHGKTENHRLKHTLGRNMGVSKNNGNPKSSILIGFSIINHPFWGPAPIFWKHPYANVPRRLSGLVYLVSFAKTQILQLGPYSAWRPCCGHRNRNDFPIRGVLWYPVLPTYCIAYSRNYSTWFKLWRMLNEFETTNLLTYRNFRCLRYI